MRGNAPAELWTLMEPPVPVMEQFLRTRPGQEGAKVERSLQHAFTQRTGWARILRRVGSEPPRPATLRFRRGRDGWAVEDELPPHQIAEAHLLEAPDPQASALPVMEHLGAQAMEQVLAQEAPGKAVRTFHVKRVLAGDSAAEFTASCVVEGREAPIVRRYLVVRGASGWTLDGELGPEEKYDVLGHRVIRKR